VGVGWGMMLRWGKISCVAGLLLALVASSGSAAGQDKPEAPTPKTPSAPQSQTASEQNLPASPGLTAPQDENPKRILGIIPNFETKNDAPAGYEPMSVKEKYVLAWHQSVDFSAHFGNAFQAALQQASNGQPHYGQGWGAYAQRFGAAEADQVTSSFFIFGFLPHVLHDDPRYFRQGKGSVWYRIHYAATRTVITRRDSGEPTFNTPQVLGQLLQQSISTAYYPQQDRSASAVFQNWGVNLAYTSAYNVLKEFYPDFLRIVFHKRRERADGTAN
jgi:hypothetical protein